MEDIIKGRFTMSNGADVLNGITGLLYARLHQGSYRNRKSKFQDFSRTFQGLCTFFQESFFIDSNSPNTAYMLDFYPI